MAHLTSLLLLLWVGVTVSTVVNVQKRIYGGTCCNNDERLYHVSLSTRNDGKPGDCGGSLISNQWILTAAHCNEKPIFAVLGVHPGPGKAEEIVDIKTYPHVDLMLLKLKNTITGITPVALPECKKDKNNKIIDEPKIDDEVQIAGHGRYKIDLKTLKKLPGSPTHLQCGNMHVVHCDPSVSLCAPDVPLDNRMCYYESNVDACHGDSGGGVIYKKKIYGVIIGGDECACTEPSISVKVCPYIDWIKKEISK